MIQRSAQARLGGAMLALALATSAAAQSNVADPTEAEFTISAGLEGGNYHRIAGRLRTQLSVDHGSYVKIVPSDGSLENLARLEDPRSPVNVGLTQADALGRYLDESPAFAEEFLVLADVGKECVFLVTAAKGRIGTAADLKREDALLSVGSPNSGAAVTWEAMSHIEPAFRKTRTAHVEVMEALLQLQNGPPLSDLDAVMWVQRPRVVSPPLEVVLENPERFRIAAIRADDLASPALPGGEPVYSHDRVRLRHAGQEVGLKTVCTRGLLLAARSKLSEASRRKLIGVLLASPDYITGPE